MILHITIFGDAKLPPFALAIVLLDNIMAMATVFLVLLQYLTARLAHHPLFAPIAFQG